MPWSLLAGALTLLYPLLLWCANGAIAPRWLAAVLLLTVAARLPGLKAGAAARWLGPAALALAALAIAADAMLPLKLYPVLVNLGLLIAFGRTLGQPESFVERLARVREPNLPPRAVAYTRRVTQLWCGFFIFNGATCALLALYGSDALWSFYTGVLSYLLMGALFGGEYLVRQRLMGRQHA